MSRRFHFHHSRAGAGTGESFELPALRKPPNSPIADPDWLRLSDDGSAVLAAVYGGVGLWDRARGDLAWWHPRAETAWPLDGGQVLLVAEYQRRLVRYAWPSMTVLDEVPTVVPTCGGGIEALVPSPTHRYAAAWLNSGQGENGYDVYRVDGPLARVTHLQHAANPMNHPPMYCLPVFSPDERVLACAPGVRAEVAWWTPPYSAWPHDWTGEEAEIPSLGGPTTFGTLVLHDLERDAESTYPLRFRLGAGWLPADPGDSRWRYGPIGLEFPAEDRIRLTLPDGTPVDLALPLPPTVTLPTPARRLPSE